MIKPPLEEVIKKYGIQLKRGKALCPFHDEKTPSFSVKGEMFKCFGCDAGGDVIDFVMMMERCDFKTAINRLNIGNFEAKAIVKQRKIEQKRREIKQARYWKTYSAFAEADKAMMTVPKHSPAWFVLNEIAEEFWHKSQMMEVD